MLEQHISCFSPYDQVSGEVLPCQFWGSQSTQKCVVGSTSFVLAFLVVWSRIRSDNWACWLFVYMLRSGHFLSPCFSGRTRGYARNWLTIAQYSWASIVIGRKSFVNGRTFRRFLTRFPCGFRVIRLSLILWMFRWKLKCKRVKMNFYQINSFVKQTWHLVQWI